MMIKVIGSFVELPLYLQETVMEMFHNLPVGGRQKTVKTRTKVTVSTTVLSLIRRGTMQSMQTLSIDAPV